MTYIDAICTDFLVGFADLLFQECNYLVDSWLEESHHVLSALALA
jgi:hypothetical protein